MENNFYIPHSSAEDDALQGLTWAAQIMYLRGIRRYVNFSTGIAGGHEIRLSWQRFKVCLEVIRPNRSKTKSADDRPTRQFIRGRVKELENAGLVTLLPSPKNRKEYVFLLPKIDKGVVRLFKEQPKKLGYEQPHNNSSQNSYQNHQEQPSKTIKEQPQLSASFMLSNSPQAIDFNSLYGFGGIQEQPKQQPSKQGDEQPYGNSSQISYQNQQEQPSKTSEEQPYIYIEKKRIEEDASLSVDQKGALSIFLDRLASDKRFRTKSLLTNQKHWKIFVELVTKDRMTKDELIHILKNITATIDEKFAIQLVKHQLDFYRKEQQTKPQRIAKPETIKPVPLDEKQTKLMDLHYEIQNLERLISASNDANTQSLQSQLEARKQEQASLQSA